MNLFADLIRKADASILTSHRGPRNLLEQIPADKNGVFTYRDAISARLKNSKDEAGTSNMLSQWKSRGYIEYLADGTFRKLLR
jgi:hypothetical protein